MEGKEIIVFWFFNFFFSNFFVEGLIDINMSEIGMDYVYEFFFKDSIFEFGGYWKFFDCMFRWKVGCGVRFEVLGSSFGICRFFYGIYLL